MCFFPKILFFGIKTLMGVERFEFIYRANFCLIPADVLPNAAENVSVEFYML